MNVNFKQNYFKQTSKEFQQKNSQVKQWRLSQNQQVSHFPGQSVEYCLLSRLDEFCCAHASSEDPGICITCFYYNTLNMFESKVIPLCLYVYYFDKAVV